MKIVDGSKWGANLENVQCPQCETKLPAIRPPGNMEQFLWGGWTCPECGCKVDKWGKPVAESGKKSVE